MRRPGRREIGVVTLVSALVLVIGVSNSASAAPGAPTWDDVEQARGNVEATESTAARIAETVAVLEQEYAVAMRTALEFGEQHQVATIARDEADASLRAVERRRDAALARAAESAQRAAQLAAQLARVGGGDLTTALMLSGDDADDLLYRLGTVSALSVRSDDVLTRALSDRNVASSLTAQADVALTEREALATEAQAALDQATSAAQAAEDQLAEQEATMGVLAAQLATLTGRSATLEREYLDSLGNPASGGGGAGPAPDAPAPSPNTPGAPGTPAPNPSSPAPPPSAPPPSGPAPNASVVAAAIAFAKQQLGEPWVFGGSGPSTWDCSGLTMMSYSAAGLSIGGHSVSAQYNRAASRGLLVPYAQAQAGDLIFYTNGGSSSGPFYHVAIYLGGGQMIESPSPGKSVRIVTVRNFDRVGVVARVSG